MATRPDRFLNHTLIRTGTVKAASAVTLGKCIILDGSGAWLDCTAGQASGGVALVTAAAAAKFEYAMPGSGVVPVLVGTGGATEGLYAVVVSDGVTNSGTLGGGTTLVNVVGKFTQTGVAGDYVGMIPMSFATVKA